MNCEKANELFSEYHEKTLAEGLRLKVNRHFENCASCVQQFEAFERTYHSFATLSPSPVPDDLDELIARRLDKVDFDRRQAAKPFAGWLKIGVAAAAAAAFLTIALVYKADSHRGTGANLFPPITGQVSGMTIEKVNGVVTISFIATEKTRVDVLEGGTVTSILPPNDAKPIRVDMIEAGARYDVPVNVDGPIPQPLWLKVSGKKDTVGIFFPQPAVLTSRAFTGDVPETLQALANGFGVVVEARLVGPGKSARQNLAGEDVVAVAKIALADTPYKQISLKGGVLHVH